MMRGGPARLSAVLVAGVLALGVAQGTHDRAGEIHDWSQAQVAYVEQGVSVGDSPNPPATFVLIETSADGSALGLEIGALVQDLGQSIDLGSPANGDEALEDFHQTVCFAISGLLENRIDPGNPREMMRIIDGYLAANGSSQLDYLKARSELEKIYRTLRRALSSDELSREVADALCDVA
jgi:hypothetical protein